MQIDILYYQFSGIRKGKDEIIYLFSFYKPQSFGFWQLQNQTKVIIYLIAI